MVIPWFMSIRHRNFHFLIKKCGMLMVKPSAFDVSKLWNLTPTALLLTFIRREFENIVNKHINFVFSAIWLVLLIFPSFW